MISNQIIIIIANTIMAEENMEKGEDIAGNGEANFEIVFDGQRFVYSV